MDNEYINQHKHKDLGFVPTQVKGSGRSIKPRKLCARSCGRHIDGGRKYCVFCKADVEREQRLVRDKLKYQRKKLLKNL